MDGLKELLVAGTALGDAKTIPDGAYPFAVIPADCTVQDLEHLLPAPVRIREQVTAKTVETCCAYLNRFKNADSVVFADQDSFRLIGVIDYHAKDKPARCDHLITYTAPKSLEWQTWRAHSGKTKSQAEFAQFIEDNVVDIVSPVGATVLEVARGLQAKKDVAFTSAIRLADGSQQFTYNDQVSGTTVKGQIAVPEEFKLGIPVFSGGPAYEVTARLRYRIPEGKLVMWYELYRPEYIEKDAFEAVCTEVNKQTGIEIWHGAIG